MAFFLLGVSACQESSKGTQTQEPGVTASGVDMNTENNPGQSGTMYVGSYDDLPIDDNDILALKLLLDDKWTFFLYEMDLYSLERDSANNDAMVRQME